MSTGVQTRLEADATTHKIRRETAAGENNQLPELFKDGDKTVISRLITLHHQVKSKNYPFHLDKRHHLTFL